ncbi:transcription antitermination factor NusB [candidate division WWE3 bacterium RIFCSPLOWO2_12_FULL_36_10]|uniref:Transcription antitermination protein NusB n=1 Tax=candidate division WWE3 bacterium RIFCSPLOWO2_12_FULL_36_10 TaxID=1802630 RepID=A0A1F4VL38_UNCKA|nr:MAG: transcription antitermination factor NusB [candidate division WWE3 bacterium RIFCSPLOWO2_12_FULL_36_10]
MGLKSDPRHQARKIALATIFCWVFQEGDNKDFELLSKELLECGQADFKLVEIITEGVETNNSKIDKIIQDNATDWPLEKVSKIDLVILRIAVFELLKLGDIPMKVVVDEAVELAKEFGSDSSSKFVNGVLGSIVDNLENLSL